MGSAEVTWPRVNFDYNGCDVLVTGGTSGIGSGIAAAFAAAGARVTVTGTRADRAEYPLLPAKYGYARLRLDHAADIAALTERFAHLDVLVNNAGGTEVADDFERTVQINLTAVYHVCNALHASLCASRFPGGASVINLGSMMSLFGSRHFPAYSAAKGGLILLTRSLAARWAADSIRVNAVAPGSVLTPMTQRFADDPELHAAICQRTPLGRWGEPRDIAGAALLLCTPAAAFITGHTLVADGGYSITDL